MKKEKGKNAKVIRNNLYACRLLWKLCPGLVIHQALICMFGYLEWLFYSAFFMRYVINALETQQAFSRIMVFLGITIAVFASLSFYTNYVEGKVNPVSKEIVYKKLNMLLYEKSSNVELACFEDNEFYDRYTLALDKATENLIDTVKNIWGVVFGIIASVAAFILMFEVDPWSVLFILFPILGNFVFNQQVAKNEFQRNKETAPHNRKIAYVNRVMYLSDYAKEIRLTNAFALMRRYYAEAIRGIWKVTGKYTVKSMIYHWLSVMFTFSFIFEGLLIYGAYRTIVHQSMSLAQLSVITSMMVSTTWILIGFTDNLTTAFKKGLFVDNLRTFMEYEEKIPENYQGEDPGTEINEIEFRNVSFSYKDEQVIHNLSFRIEGGKTYALVGHNGAGKSTIIKLLLRFYDPTEGVILLNGKDIKTYELAKYRALFATAFQDYQIFSLSVLENVLMHPAKEGDEAVAVQALKLAGVYDKICSLPKGIHTILTKEFAEEGAVLSGGEYQKIVVARAMANPCPVKIYDEPSSALDPIAEYELFKNILKSGKKNTMLFISHRLSSVQKADCVFMLENGTVIESGTHAQLLKQKGSYQQMYEKQAINYLAGAKHEAGIFAMAEEVEA